MSKKKKNKEKKNIVHERVAIGEKKLKTKRRLGSSSHNSGIIAEHTEEVETLLKKQNARNAVRLDLSNLIT